MSNPPPPANYQTPIPQEPNSDDKMTTLDWVLSIVCSVIGCIVGIVYLVQGKKKGGMMIGISILFVVIWNIVWYGAVAPRFHR